MEHLVFGFGLAGIRPNQRSPKFPANSSKRLFGEAHGNKAEAMILGVRRRLLYEKLTEFGLT